MYINRKEIYRKMQKPFGKVLTYVTGDIPNFSGSIAPDAVDVIVRQLESIGPQEKITLFLYTKGGDISAAWNIVNLLRMYADKFSVIIPRRALSSGTLICLGADEIYMTKQATISPIDPTINTELNPMVEIPVNQLGNPPQKQKVPMPVSVEDINSYLSIVSEGLKIKDSQALADVLIELSEKIHPLVLGKAYRAKTQVKMLAEKLLANQTTDETKIKKIIDFLCQGSGSHDHTINRKEAQSIGLNIKKLTDEQYELVKHLYNDIEQELGLSGTHVNWNVAPIFIKAALIESLDGGIDYFRWPISQGPNQPPQGKMGWIHENPKEEILSD